MSIESLKQKAKNIRQRIVRMIGEAKTSHVGGALSAADILTALYFEVMSINPKKPDWQKRDRFILSKGHAAAALYATLAERGFFPPETLKTFLANGSSLTGHPSFQCVPGVEASTGSLGHGLSIGIGMALGSRYDGLKNSIYVLISDGECDEGSVWEGVLFAGCHALDNLTVIIDYNKIQSFGRTKEVLDIEPLKEKFKAFRWDVEEIQGHDLKEIVQALRKTKTKKGKPRCIIAHTVKGKGVSFMENKLEWHYFNPS